MNTEITETQVREWIAARCAEIESKFPGYYAALHLDAMRYADGAMSFSVGIGSGATSRHRTGADFQDALNTLVSGESKDSLKASKVYYEAELAKINAKLEVA